MRLNIFRPTILTKTRETHNLQHASRNLCHNVSGLLHPSSPHISPNNNPRPESRKTALIALHSFLLFANANPARTNWKKDAAAARSHGASNRKKSSAESLSCRPALRDWNSLREFYSPGEIARISHRKFSASLVVVLVVADARNFSRGFSSRFMFLGRREAGFFGRVHVPLNFSVCLSLSLSLSLSLRGYASCSFFARVYFSSGLVARCACFRPSLSESSCIFFRRFLHFLCDLVSWKAPLASYLPGGAKFVTSLKHLF